MSAARNIPAATVLGLLLSGCGGRVCPASVTDLQSSEFAATLTSESVVGIGTVSRFVDSPDPDFRGYDLNVEVRHFGLRDGRIQTFLLAMQDPLPDVELGGRVVFVGPLGEGARILPDCLEPLATADPAP